MSGGVDNSYTNFLSKLVKLIKIVYKHFENIMFNMEKVFWCDVIQSMRNHETYPV